MNKLISTLGVALVAGCLSAVAVAQSHDPVSEPTTHADKKAAKAQAKADHKTSVAQAKADKQQADAQADADKATADAKEKDAKKE
ncbi:hypothetical protein [Paraburkholderia megapolitana]|uniref:Colicin import membrane protein n=1 Tax=Paraburkholderia megapolitana TaxID=420953 RepID=A0A1I3JDJ0_9BURK|nr:hypothetical protein [Paraburkholderia megapolitana]QDQ84835.1 hypothetical protein FNZ07_27685 [Paraburkholderia megapolitana]SFI58216.1 hypothetical protein SAMN05192543_103662 [Paraburkholderia megapolitana]